MKNNIFKLTLLVISAFIFQACGTYKIFTGTVKYESSKNNEVLKSKELKSYLEEKNTLKFVLRTPPGFDTYSGEEQTMLNSVFAQIEKELIKNGQIVKDRVLLERLLSIGDKSLIEVGKAINTDIIIEIINIDFDIPNKVKDFKIKEKGINANFDSWNNIDYVDCRLSMLECRITLVELGNVGGIFKFFVSGCDNGNDFYIHTYEDYSGNLDPTKECLVGWNYGNVSYKSLTNTYNMNEMSRNKAIERLVKSLLNQLIEKE
ncbi:MAG: hypothetical protein B6D61_10785 [Bacteroidetes bacterium 4484_249]|nr:MAG: hypothetical protein B6D61_10785 [Bacteroidetes bacterium 4484_249]